MNAETSAPVARNKNIVLCSDGTGNAGGRSRGTNVWRMFTALDLNGHDLEEKKWSQVAIHDDGVGTEKFSIVKAIGGAFGLGLNRNIRQLYIFLCKTYRPGDQIFIFGFSRGAYTARALASLIAHCGVIDTRNKSEKELKVLTKEAVTILRKAFYRGIAKRLRGNCWIKEQKQKRAENARLFRKHHAVQHPEFAPNGQVEIRFLGVWDTVDAYGVPWDGLSDFIHYFIYPYKFPDRKLNPRVLKACHAIAIDDERQTFSPVLWDQSDGDHVRINQVWFAGVHSNVGGGYAKDGMALVSLDWMMSEAEKALDDEHPGLNFLPHKREETRATANVYDKQYDSRSGLAVYYRYKPRDIGQLCADNGIKKPRIHLTALKKAIARVGRYAPGNLPSEITVQAIDHGHSASIATSNLAALEKAFADADNGEKLLHKVKFYAAVRQFLHHALLLMATGVLLFAAVSINRFPKLHEATESTETLTSIIERVLPFGDRIFQYVFKPLIVYPNLGFALLSILILVWAIGYLAKSKMQQLFSEFWNRVSSRAEDTSRVEPATIGDRCAANVSGSLKFKLPLHVRE